VKKQSRIKQMRRIAREHGTTIEFARQGKHEIWICEGISIPVPRHDENTESTAKSILTALTDHLENR
jgi:hypothetical protein